LCTGQKLLEKIRDRLSELNRDCTFSYGRFNIKELNDVGGKQQFRIGISNRFVALENVDAEVDINSNWETRTRISKTCIQE
jgi:hypothetical protein